MTDENTNEAVEETTNESVQAAEVKPDELLEDFKGWIADGMEDDDIIMKLSNDHDLSISSAVARYRKLKGQAGMTSPRGHKAEEVQAFIQAQVDDGKERADIIEAMVEKFGYTKKSAQSTFSTQGKKLGITGEGSGISARVPMSDVVAFLRANQDLKKQELVAKMVAELEYAESTCGAYYNYIPMAVEWARQEKEG